MSFSLSSLLNPSPSEEQSKQEQKDASDAQQQQQQSSSTPRRDSLPPISYVQSPELVHTQLPKYTPPQRPRPSITASSHEATKAISSAQTAQHSNASDWQDRRASIASTTAGVFELPPMPEAGTRTMSSPTLDQYHVVSRSPEQKRASISASTVASYALPPLQNTTTPSALPQVSEQANAQGLHGKEKDVVRSELAQAVQTSASASLVNQLSTYEPPLVTIKQEHVPSPHNTSFHTSKLHSPAEQEESLSKPLSSLKHEHTSRTQSPLRESSVAIPTTEEISPNTTNMKKRPPPKVKKGTATTTKKPRPTIKKRKTTDIKNNKNHNKGTPSSPDPSEARSAQDEYDEEEDSQVGSDEDAEGSGEVYCICRKPDNGTFMIGCDGGCEDWFHGKCVGIEERDKILIQKYICEGCEKLGRGKTLWSRMCRRQGCRKPARVGRNAKGGSESKYCSDECGVLFFRQMTANSRGAEQARKDRASRRKTDSISTADAGARGGILSAGEVKAILDQVDSIADFKELGNGVLSPPATPSAAAAEHVEMDENELDAINTISTKKAEARQRHQLLKDRLKFITLAKNEATRAATEKELKPKDYCGFDARLEWTEEEFAEWRQTKEAQQVFELDTLEKSALDLPDASETPLEEKEVCSRKKCARHVDWSKLAVDDIRFEMSDNSDRMRTLEQDEQNIKERATTRAKAQKFGEDEGSVELHTQSKLTSSATKVNEHVAATESMDLDIAT